MENRWYSNPVVEHRLAMLLKSAEPNKINTKVVSTSFHYRVAILFVVAGGCQ